MGDTYFLKTAKLGNLIDFYVTNVKYAKLSVSFNLIAKIKDEATESDSEIINTNMTFVAINIETEKPVILNPELFELAEFKDCLYQKNKINHPAVTLEKGNKKSDYKKKYLALVYLELCNNNPADAIMRFQKDWGKIFSNQFLTDTISLINS
jgi:acyl-CoA hydrolase